MGTNLNDRWLLPEGIEEALPEQAFRLEAARRTIIDLYKSWGYELVMPPLIEYLESLLTGTGRDLDLQTFKLTDQLNGRTMGVRADLTPQVARIDAHRLKQEGPTRLCYLGTALRTRPDGFGGSRSPLQLGAELYGFAGVEADAEIVSLLLETLKITGIQHVHLDIGHVGFLTSLVEHYGFDAPARALFFEMLQRKAVTEIGIWLDQQDLGDADKEALLRLPMLCGSRAVIEEARTLFASTGGEVITALDSLESLVGLLEVNYPTVAVNFDLGDMHGFNYETGIVFAAYVPGEGAELARGGRYDGIGKDFGRDRPAVGFSADLKRLMGLSSNTTKDSTRRIFATAEVDRDTLKNLRTQGNVVVCELQGQAQGAGAMGCGYQLVKSQDTWAVEPVVEKSE